jgi:hypothetical protein
MYHSVGTGWAVLQNYCLLFSLKNEYSEIYWQLKKNYQWNEQVAPLKQYKHFYAAHKCWREEEWNGYHSFTKDFIKMSAKQTKLEMLQYRYDIERTAHTGMESATGMNYSTILLNASTTSTWRTKNLGSRLDQISSETAEDAIQLQNKAMTTVLAPYFVSVIIKWFMLTRSRVRLQFVWMTRTLMECRNAYISSVKTAAGPRMMQR